MSHYIDLNNTITQNTPVPKQKFFRRQNDILMLQCHSAIPEIQLSSQVEG